MEDYVTIDMPPSLWKLYVGNGKTKRKSPEYKNWIQVAHWQLNQQKKIIGKVDGKFRIHLLLSRSRASCDLDNYIKPVLDVLQSYGVIENDKFCEESTQKWHYLSDHVCFLKIERIEEEMFAASAINTNKAVAEYFKRKGETEEIKRIKMQNEERQNEILRMIEFKKKEKKDEEERKEISLVEYEGLHSVVAAITADNLEDVEKPSVKSIIQFVTRGTDIGHADIVSISRKKEVAALRQYAVLCAWALRHDMSYPTLGKIFGGRDHTTMMYSVSKFGVETKKQAIEYVRNRENLNNTFTKERTNDQ